MLKQEKQKLLSELNAILETKKEVILMKHISLKFSDLEFVRRKAPASTIIKVIKNSMASLMFKDKAHKALTEELRGQTILVFSDNVFNACKVANMLKMKNKKTEIIAGICENSKCNSSSIISLAKAGSIDQLRSIFLSVLQSPLSRIAQVIKAKAEQA